MTFLDVKGLTKTFGGLTAVNNVDFSMENKQIVSVIGPNGAGKTTFFNVISGYYHDHGGTITFDNQSLKDLTPEKVASYGIARTFQNIRLFQDMLTVENILVGMHLHMKSNLFDIAFKTKRMRREEKEAYDKAMELLKYVGLEGKDNELAKNLSYGEQRRLEIARALAVRPKLLLLDEPAAGLNPKETEEMKQFIIRLRDELGHAILLIEHDMKLVMGLSDKITVINYGVKIADGTPEEIKNNPEVIKAYLGSDADSDEVA
ncbi:lipopolysaccharide export system ATP-binding protein LptB [Oxobacter pfennigii]|uniref:Lipopolysaccharide export system ATP-binding protein LptB n=1 Tax=Oxobacter pfennigii TaxID=36849 RepID=A0A0P8WAL7_9CLOT|nr:ATP-binding cassette domain-containing protein [Oxobacter pfennigii]KPU45661.1 lipopolysaccharide export system ATP-binding protein LptB [Oxobacter pfennigii]